MIADSEDIEIITDEVEAKIKMTLWPHNLHLKRKTTGKELLICLQPEERILLSCTEGSREISRTMDYDSFVEAIRVIIVKREVDYAEN